MSYFKAEMRPNSISAGGPPPHPAGELIALPRSLAGFKGPTSKGKEGREKGGKDRARKGRAEREGKEKQGERKE